MSGRIKTDYPGVFYREADRIGGKGIERVYYVVYKKQGKVYEEKVGRQYADNMTPAKASHYRSERIEGKRLSRKELRIKEEERKAAEAGKYTLDRLWQEYRKNRPEGKSLAIDEGRYEKHLKSEFGEKQPNEIIRLDIDRLRNRLSKKLSPQTVKHILNLFTWIINYGVKNGLCDHLPFHVQKPTVNNIKTEDLTPEQLVNLLKAIDEDTNIQVANIMKLALFTGMRRGELFKLKWDDIDFDRRFIHIRSPKGGKDATIPINNTAYTLLKTHPKTKSPYVFPGKEGEPRTSIRAQANKIKEKAGIPKDFRALHGLRHVFASMLASSGEVDMYTLQKLLTHKSPLMTQRYAHLRDDALRNASNLAGNLISDAGHKKNNVVELGSADTDQNS